MAKVYKGWLKTRKGDYFSPNTLAESLYSREGAKYDDVVKGYVQNAKIELETTQMTVSQKVDDLYKKLKNFDGSDSDTFYVVDNDGNIILRVDAEGGHSIDFKSLNYSLEKIGDTLDNIKINDNGIVTAKDFKNENGDSFNSTREELSILQTDFVEKFRNLDTSDTDTLYIVDSNGNIIVKVDDTGVTSINYNVPGLISYVELVELVNAHYDEFAEKLDNTKELLQNNINGVQTNLDTFTVEVNNRLKNFNGDDSNTLYIIDSDGNIIARVDGTGVHSINFTTSQYDVNTTLNQLDERIVQEIKDRQTSDANVTNHVDNSINTLQKSIDDRLKNFDGSDSDILYITDAAGNIIARVDKLGVHSINFTTSQYDVNNMLSSLDTRLIQEIADRIAGDNTVKKYVDDTAQTIQQSLTQTDNKVNTLIGSDPDKSVRTIANEELATQLLSGKADADFKTLQQLATWLEDHPEDVNAINLAIQVIQGQLGGFDETTNAVKNYIDNATNTLQQDMNNRLKNFDSSDSDALYVVDSNNYKIAQIDKDGVRSINFISNEYDMNAELKSLGERINTEASTRAAQDEIYYKKHQDELNTHTVWDTQQHTTLQNNINTNTQLINQVNETLSKAMFYDLQGSITFPDDI